MAIFKCKMCGGDLEISEGLTVAECEYCGTKQTLPKLDDDKRANMYDRANHFRRNNEFDKAMGIYEQILNEDNTDAEAYWSLVLCRYGIEYVEDPASHKRVPTVNRAQFTSVFDDDNYKSALNYADAGQRAVYEDEAKAINEIQKGILAISQKEEPFDVFICYKETDNNGRRTPDSVLANDLYHQLTQEGFKVFFARITLEDKLGSAYEPYIFAALNSAKVMVALGTKPEYFKAVWVRNEWSRYLALIKQGQTKMLIPAYKDMDPYDLPEEFSHLQAQDMSKLGFMQDLIRGIKKIVGAGEPKQPEVAKETVVTGANTTIAPLLKRAFMFLEDGEWNSANEYCEKVLDQDPENAQAYLGKLMAELQVRTQESLKDQAKSFDDNINYQKAIRFADEELKSTLSGYIEHINTRNENARLDGIYTRAKNVMSAANTEGDYKKAAQLFESAGEYRDAVALAQTCYENAETARKDRIYNGAISLMNKSTGPFQFSTGHYEAAIKSFQSISGWKDADEKVVACLQKIDEIKAQALEHERQAELARKEAERIAKRNKKITIITISVAIAIITFLIIWCTVIIPNGKYNDAVALMDAGRYEEAISAFEALNGHRDSFYKIIECEYNIAVALMDAGRYTEAIVAFEDISGYKDSADKITECNTVILDGKYNDAMTLMNAGKYTAAISAFEALNGHRDSKSKITECKTAILDGKYNDAIALMDAGRYEEAISALEALNGHRDSNQRIEQCNINIYGQEAWDRIKYVRVGGTYKFGSYEQDNNKDNGPEDIEWLVLSREGSRILVISEYALDGKRYNTSDTEVTWETCSLRNWLNNDFINSAFTAYEKAMIPTVTVSADKNPRNNTNPGNATQDRVFLLSTTEVNKYFSYNYERQCYGTDYVDDLIITGEYHGRYDWWLRSPGHDQLRAACVDYDGSVSTFGHSVDSKVAVRPAMWIDLG